MQLNIKIGGMTCAGCVSSIENSVRKIKGVKDIRVDLEEQKATVIYDGGANVIKDIVSTISRKGYYVIPEKLIIFTDLVSSDIKKEIEKIEGVISVQTFIDEIDISYISQNPEKILREVQKLGVRVLRYVKGGDKDLQSDLDVKALRRDFLISLPPAIYFLVRMFFHHLDYLKYIDFLVCSSIIPLAYSRFARGFFKKLINFSSDMNVLVSLGVFSAYIFSVVETFFSEFLPGNFLFYESSAIITSVVLLGRYIEMSVRKKGYGVLRKIIEMEPQLAIVLENGKEVQKSISELRQGDRVVVREGVRVPADGNIIRGRMKIDESHITGEIQPVVKNHNERVFCGSLVLEGWGLIEVENIGDDTILRKMIRAIKESRFKKTSFERLSDKISAFFVPSVILISLVSFVFWIFYVPDFAFALERSISVLVVACPCALGLATPTALLSAVVKSAGLNIVVRNASAFELIPMIKNIAFDKTGTLTEGKLRIKDVVIYDESYNLKSFIELVASAESVSDHKIAQALVDYSAELGCNIKPPESFFSLKGKGIWAKVENIEVIIGNEKILKDFGLEVPDVKFQNGYSRIYVFFQRKFAGVIAVEEKINQLSYEVVDFLRKNGKDIYLITGDSLGAAHKVAVNLGIDKVFAGVLPDEKVKIISEIKKKGYTAMVGDGINDAPALSSADVGIAVNSASEISKISSDVVVPSLKLLPVLFRLSSYVVKTIKMNLFWAFLYNLILIPIAAGVLYKFGIFINPMLSALAMSLSSIFVVVNSLTVLSKRFGNLKSSV